MAVIKTTLSRQTSNGLRYVYPKTSADIVEYNSGQSLKEKIDQMVIDINAAKNNSSSGGSVVSSSNVSLGKLETKNIDIQTMEYEILDEL